jgi:hypothetical protein
MSEKQTGKQIGPSPWAEPGKVELFRRLWLPPHSLSVREIAERLGVSIAACTAKGRRLGLERRPNPNAGGMIRLPTLGGIPPRMLGRRGPAAKSTLPTLESVRGVEIERLASSAFLDRPGRVVACCWVISDRRPWLYCDAPSVPGKHYCVRHHHIAQFGSAGTTETAGAVRAETVSVAAAVATNGGSPSPADSVPPVCESTYGQNAGVVASNENSGDVATVA